MINTVHNRIMQLSAGILFFRHVFFKINARNVAFSTRALAQYCTRTLVLLRFISAALSLLLIAGCGNDDSEAVESSVKKVFSLSIVKQMPLSCETSLPVAVGEDFVVADELGSVRRFNNRYQLIWSVSHAGMDFSPGITVADDSLLAVSDDGHVVALNAQDGAILWTNTLDDVFYYPPLSGVIENNPVFWFLAAGSGAVFCLNVSDGSIIWKSEETNRSDGGMVIWNQRLVYGNCDGAAHVFSAVTGEKIASVPVGESDQMAGTPVVTEDGMLFIGTRQGKLAVIDLNRNVLAGSVSISEQEAFTVPVRCNDNTVVFGLGEGGILRFSLKDDKPFVKNRFIGQSAVEYLLYDDEMIYALAGSNMLALNDDLKLQASLNIGDNLSGMQTLGKNDCVVKADRSLLFVKGVWK